MFAPFSRDKRERREEHRHFSGIPLRFWRRERARTNANDTEGTHVNAFDGDARPPHRERHPLAGCNQIGLARGSPGSNLIKTCCQPIVGISIMYTLKKYLLVSGKPAALCHAADDRRRNVVLGV